MSTHARLPRADRRCRILRHRRRDRTRPGGIHDFELLEAGDGVGGTWHWNTYPGIAVDIPSFSYQFSFEQSPRWSRTYAPGRELKPYAEHCVDKYGIRSRIRFNTKVISRRIRRRTCPVAGADRPGGRGHRAIPDQRQRRADRAELARHRRRGLLRRHHHAHRAVGPHPGPDRQAGRRHRHRRLGRASHPRDRADRRASAPYFSAPRSGAFPSSTVRCRRRPAAAMRIPGGKVLQRLLSQAYVEVTFPISAQYFTVFPLGQTAWRGGSRLSAPSGRRSSCARQAHPALRRGLQTAGLPQRLPGHVQPRQRAAGHRAHRQDHAVGGGHR